MLQKNMKNKMSDNTSTILNTLLTKFYISNDCVKVSEMLLTKIT